MEPVDICRPGPALLAVQFAGSFLMVLQPQLPASDGSIGPKDVVRYIQIYPDISRYRYICTDIYIHMLLQVVCNFIMTLHKEMTALKFNRVLGGGFEEDALQAGFWLTDFFTLICDMGLK